MCLVETQFRDCRQASPKDKGKAGAARLPARPPRLLPRAPFSAESRSGRAADLEVPLVGRRRAPGSNGRVGGRGIGVPPAFGPWGSLHSKRWRLDFLSAGREALKIPPIGGRG